MNTETETRDIGPHHCDGHFVLMHDRGYGGEGRAYYPLHSVLKGDDLHLKGRAVCSCGYEQDFEMTIPLPAGCEPDLNTLSLSHMKGHPLILSFKDGHGMSQRISGPVFDLPKHADEDMKALTVAGDYPLHRTKLKIAQPAAPIIEEGPGSRGLESTTLWDRLGPRPGQRRTRLWCLKWYGATDEVCLGRAVVPPWRPQRPRRRGWPRGHCVACPARSRLRRLRHPHEPHEPQVRSLAGGNRRRFSSVMVARAKGYTVEVVE